MKAKALYLVVPELPESLVLIEYPDGTRSVVTGFQVRKDESGESAIILKVPAPKPA